MWPISFLFLHTPVVHSPLLSLFLQTPINWDLKLTFQQWGKLLVSLIQRSRNFFFMIMRRSTSCQVKLSVTSSSASPMASPYHLPLQLDFPGLMLAPVLSSLLELLKLLPEPSPWDLEGILHNPLKYFVFSFLFFLLFSFPSLTKNRKVFSEHLENQFSTSR